MKKKIHLRNIAWSIVAGGVVYLVFGLLLFPVVDAFSIDRLLSLDIIVVLMVFGGPAALVFVFLTKRIGARHASTRLYICRRCGYDLRGLTEARCPECGHRFDSRLLNKFDVE